MKTLVFVLGFLMALAGPAMASGNPVSIVQTVTAVPATTSTLVAPQNSGRQSLAIYLQTSGAACTFGIGGAATTSGLTIGTGTQNGYSVVWAAGSAPSEAVYLDCTTTSSVVTLDGR